MAAATPAPTPAPTKPPSMLALLLANHVAVLALGGALGGAVVPVWNEVKAWRLGVAASQLALVTEQDRLWRRNLSCIAQGSTWEIDGPRKLTVRITVCTETGDILARYFKNDWTPTYRWLAAPQAGDAP